MDEKIILLSDHTWFAVYTQEQAQRIMDEHIWGNVPRQYGIYIEPQNKTILYKNEEERKKYENQ